MGMNKIEDTGGKMSEIGTEIISNCRCGSDNIAEHHINNRKGFTLYCRDCNTIIGEIGTEIKREEVLKKSTENLLKAERERKNEGGKPFFDGVRVGDSV